MKKIIVLLAVATIALSGFCNKSGDGVDPLPGIKAVSKIKVPAPIQGNWMFGKFSMTEYWNQNPYTYLGNALQFAIAFTFEADGSYTHYFTSSSVIAGATIYQQSVTKGTLEVDSVNKQIRTNPISSHYKRTRSGKVVEERDLIKSELTSAASYSYKTGTEPNGTKALYLTLQGTSSPLTFLKK